MGWTIQIEYAREQRKNAIPEERKIWELLRGRKYKNLKFYRQYPIVISAKISKKEFYIADFYCHTLRLILEIDGEIHNKQVVYDTARDNVLSKLGYQIFRISNKQVNTLNENLLNILSSFIDNIKPIS